MGAAREGRPSEKTMSLINSIMPHLIVSVWHPIPDSAREYIDELIEALIKMKGQLREENNPNKTTDQVINRQKIVWDKESNQPKTEDSFGLVKKVK